MKKQTNKLTRKEQATTATYKMMAEQADRLQKSLRKIQDESEKERFEKHELDKKIVLLENKLDNKIFIEILKFLSAGGIGFSTNYIALGSYYLGASIGIPSIIVFIVCVVVDRK